VLGHEPRRPFPVAGPDGVPHQPVEQVRAFGLGPVEAPERLEDQGRVHRHGQQLAKQRMPRRVQDGLVELAVGGVQRP
jgi:hypothetical protein